MKRTLSHRFAVTLASGVAVAFACAAFAQRSPGAESKSAKGADAVKAGIDRVVVLGGKTYLSGELKSLGPKGDSPQVTWSKQSGEG